MTFVGNPMPAILTSLYGINIKKSHFTCYGFSFQLPENIYITFGYLKKAQVIK